MENLNRNFLKNIKNIIFTKSSLKPHNLTYKWLLLIVEISFTFKSDLFMHLFTNYLALSLMVAIFVSIHNFWFKGHLKCCCMGFEDINICFMENLKLNLYNTYPNAYMSDFSEKGRSSLPLPGCNCLITSGAR